MGDDTVTILDSDDDTISGKKVDCKKKRRVVTVWACVNIDCRSGQTRDILVTADQFSLSFYGAEAKEDRKRKICNVCRELARNKQKDLVDKLIKGENIFREKLPVAQDILLLEDSDEDLHTDSSDEEEIEIELSESDDGISANETLERTIQRALCKYNFDFQLNGATHNLGEKIDSMMQDIAATENMYSELERSVDNLRIELFKEHDPLIKKLPPLDITENDGTEESISEQSSSECNIPTPGEFVLIAIQDEDDQKCWITSSVESFTEGVFIVVLPDMTKKNVLSKEVAYLVNNKEGLPVGTRCVALYANKDVAMYKSCVVAEPPTIMNKNRYLIFYDNGYPAYVAQQELRVVAEQLPQVWEDIQEGGRELIREYLQQYPAVPMIEELTVGQQVKAELGGKWWMTEVLEVDCKLVLLKFDKKDNHTEWLFLGSPRLGPLFADMEAQKEKKTKRKQNESALLSSSEKEKKVEDQKESSGTTGRMVAKKTTGNKKVDKSGLDLEWESEGTIVQVQRSEMSRGVFTAHTCNDNCVGGYQYQEDEWRGTNPLLIPLMLGWDRQVAMHNNKGLRKVFYLAPCGRRLGTMHDIHKYIRMTGLQLEMDFFNFDWWLHALNEWKPARQFCNIKDISYGNEAVPVPCVNSIDSLYPEYVEYSTVRMPQKNVNINTEVEFLTGCDCQDDCMDLEKCSCRQLTIQATKGNKENKVDPNVGYEYRRLQDIVQTGIYECNQLCQCAKTCLNKVAQNPLRLKLQVFKTAKRGWGLRTLNDIPGGTYICNYVGNLYNTQEGNTYGKNFGDEYFADLDLIEIVESKKEGYESDVSDEGFTEEMSPSSNQLNNSMLNQLDGATNVDNFTARKSTSKKSSNGKRKSGGMTSAEEHGPKKEKRAKFICTRKLFGAEEMSYVMDAKTTGNIGRYLNHSCHPNVFVQNVFVDTHDLRFPWLAFYTSTFVRAGQELCWDYGYEVGSIADKEIYCSCGSFNCRGRLL